MSYKRNPLTNGVAAKVQQFFVREAALNVLEAIKRQGIDMGAEVRTLMENAVLEVVVLPKDALRSRL